MDNAQNSDKASEKQEKEAENKNDKATPGPPTEDKKTPQSVKSVSGPGDRKSQETEKKKSSKIQFKSKPTEKQKGEAKTKNKDASKTLVSPRDMVTPRDLDVKENQPGKEKRERHMALLLSWEVSWNLLGIAARLTNGNKLSDFSYVALSPPTKDSEWTPPVDQSSLVIFYSSPKSERPLYQMERYLDYCSSKKGPGKVIVVIGEEEDDVTEKWKENQFSKTLYQFRFSRAELDWITREDILQEMLEKIEKLRKSLISPTTGLQEKPSGNEVRDSSMTEVKQVPQITKKIQPAKQVKMKKQETNKQNKDNKAKMPKIQKETPSNIKTQLERHEKKSSDETKQAVRIVSWSKTDSRWLMALLRSPYFRDAVKDVETVNVIGSELEKMTEQTSSLTTYILYFSKESLELFGSQLHNSVKLLSTFEKKKTMVVIDNLDNKYTEKEATKLYHELPISSLSKHLFLFGTREMETDYLTHLTKKQQVTQEAAQKMTKFQNLINERLGTDPPPPGPRTFVIFSRSAKYDYEWLEKLLKSPKCQDFVTDVRAFYISNKGYEDFYKEVANCTFGILYHTKNRGRVNITDVTDSLYDMEIEYMSSALGRCNVLVVIDDLKDSGLKEKERILYTQPSIHKYSRNLLLVTPEEKKDEAKLLSKLMEVFMSPAMEEPEILKGAYKEAVNEVTKQGINNETEKTTTGNSDIKTDAAAIGNDMNSSVNVNDTKNSVREKNAKDATASVGEKGDTTSVGEKEGTTTSVIERDATTSVIEKDATESVVEKDTRTSVVEKNATSVIEKDVTSVVEKDTTTSVVEKDTTTSVVEKDTTTSIVEKNATSVIEKDATTLVIEKDTKTSVEEKDATASIVEKNTPTSVLGKDAKTSVVEKDTTTSVLGKDAKTSVIEKDTKTSVIEKDTKTSVVEKDTKTSVIEKDTKTSVEERDATASIIEKDTPTSAREKDAKTSVEERDATASVREKDTTASVREKDTTTSVREKDETTSVVEKDETTSVREEDGKNSIGENNAKKSVRVDDIENRDGDNDAKKSKGGNKSNNKKETALQNGANKNNELEVEGKALLTVMSEEL